MATSWVDRMGQAPRPASLVAALILGLGCGDTGDTPGGAGLGQGTAGGVTNDASGTIVTSTAGASATSGATTATGVGVTDTATNLGGSTGTTLGAGGASASTSNGGTVATGMSAGGTLGVTTALAGAPGTETSTEGVPPLDMAQAGMGPMGMTQGGAGQGGVGAMALAGAGQGGAGQGGTGQGQGGAGQGGSGGSARTGTGGSTTVDDDCSTPPTAPQLVGWATQGGGTTGGGEATPVVVTSASQLASEVSGNTAKVIYVDGRAGSMTTNGRLNVGSNKTIVGICGAEIQGSISLSNVQNVIMRNLRVVGNNCNDAAICKDGEDAIGVRTSSRLWFDHLDVSDGSDGNLDITNNSDYVTISWTKFSYSSRRTDPDAGASGHRFSNLIAGSDTDSGEYRITFHHNWWADNVDQRMPRARFGDIHVFNNLYTASGNLYCTNAGYQTHVLVQNNIYRGVNNPLSPDANGDMRAEGNVFDGTTGGQSDNGGSGFTPPYDFTPDATAGLDSTIMSEVGPRD